VGCDEHALHAARGERGKTLRNVRLPEEPRISLLRQRTPEKGTTGAVCLPTIDRKPYD
jgi:hypothetical protein